jgi:hypothetical protein
MQVEAAYAREGLSAAVITCGIWVERRVCIHCGPKPGHYGRRHDRRT